MAQSIIGQTEKPSRRSVISASSKITSVMSKILVAQPRSSSSKPSEPAILKEVVKVVPGSVGNVEHIHEDYWEPCEPGRIKVLQKLI